MLRGTPSPIRAWPVLGVFC